MNLAATDILAAPITTPPQDRAVAISPNRGVEPALRARLADNRKCLVPFFTALFPDPRRFQSLLLEAQKIGCDAVEIGIPFSDPIADGPTIQYAGQHVLEHGATLDAVLESIASLQLQIPVILMGYLNPILAYGIRRFAEDARAARVTGLIVPDLPLEKSSVPRNSSRQLNLAPLQENFECILMAAPTTDPARLSNIGRSTRGFFYAVTVTGTTGARKKIPPDTNQFLTRARAATTRPLLAGFGISNPRIAATIARRCDGVIVGSALIESIRNGTKTGAVKRASKLLHQLRVAL